MSFKKLTDNRSTGFTIVELLIVIVVIGILAAIVINTFSGVQARARNTERQTDIKSVSSQLEVYQANSSDGTYPLAATMAGTVASVTGTTLKGLDANALKAPNGADNSFTATATPAISGYGYIAKDSAGTATTTAASAVKYTVYWNEEAPTAGVKSRDSLN